jgi:hypothetical protein
MSDHGASPAPREADGASLYSSTSGRNDEHTGTSGTKESDAVKSNGSSTRANFIRNLGRAETLVVVRSKAFVYLVLAIAAALVGLATYRYTRDSETDEFKQEVSRYASTPPNKCSPSHSHSESSRLLQTKC